MATRSRIGKLNSDGTYTSIYCHFDGYPSGVGAILAKHYTDPAKIDALLALGDLSALGSEIGPPEGAAHSHARPLDNVTIAYHRDRGEDIKQTSAYHGKAWASEEYNYLFDGGRWMVRRRIGDWRPIADVILEDE